MADFRRTKAEGIDALVLEKASRRVRQLLQAEGLNDANHRVWLELRQAESLIALAEALPNFTETLDSIASTLDEIASTLGSINTTVDTIQSNQ